MIDLIEDYFAIALFGFALTFYAIIYAIFFPIMLPFFLIGRLLFFLIDSDEETVTVEKDKTASY